MHFLDKAEGKQLFWSILLAESGAKLTDIIEHMVQNGNRTVIWNQIYNLLFVDRSRMKRRTGIDIEEHIQKNVNTKLPFTHRKYEELSLEEKYVVSQSLKFIDSKIDLIKNVGYFETLLVIKTRILGNERCKSLGNIFSYEAGKLWIKLYIYCLHECIYTYITCILLI